MSNFVKSTPASAVNFAMTCSHPMFAAASRRRSYCSLLFGNAKAIAMPAPQAESSRHVQYCVKTILAFHGAHQDSIDARAYDGIMAAAMFPFVLGNTIIRKERGPPGPLFGNTLRMQATAPSPFPRCRGS